MKKNVSKITAAILSFVLMFSGVFSLIVSADESEERLPCLQDHFSRLNALDGKDRLPPNPIGSCPYVAISSLLAYYDAYWHEQFVPDELEWDQGIYDSATDTIIETFNANTEANAWRDWAIENNGELHSDDFHGFVEANQYNYLQAYLIAIGKQLGYHSNSDAYGLNGIRMVNVLEHYLYNTPRDFTEDQVTVHMLRAIDVGQDDLEATIIQKLEAGIPVIYCGLSYSADDGDAEYNATILNGIGGHAMVAFNTDGTDISLNNCWNLSESEERYYNETSYTTVDDSEYMYWNLAIWIEINSDNLPHECTDAYYDNAIEDDVCACYVYSNTHPAHCSHNYHCEPKNDTYHHDICGCGVAINQTHHTFTYSTHSTTSHTKYCSLCGYSSPEPHNFIIERESTQYHKKTCTLCGEEQIVSHYAARYVDYDSSYHRMYCSCGEYMGFASHIAASTGKLQSYCVYCNRSMLNPGSGGIIPGIMGKPDESGEYTE